MAIDNNITRASGAQSLNSKFRSIDNFMQCGHILQDLSAEVKLEYQKMRNRLQKAEMQTEAAAKAAFLDNMRHKFITPLAGIVMLVEAMERKEQDRERLEQFQQIRLTSMELLNIFKQLLEFGNISSGMHPVNIIAVDIRQIINGIKNLMSVATNCKNLQFIVEIDKTVPQHIHTDQFRLRMILINLISNAIEFTETGYVKLSVTVSKHSLILAVEDSGKGFDMQNSEYILGAFNTLMSAYKTADSGLGLGLAIVNKFMRELDGTLQIKSQIGKGSLFECILPLNYNRLKILQGIYYDKNFSSRGFADLPNGN